MILGALDDAGGQAYLAEQAHQNPAAFLTLLGRVLPREPVESPPAVVTLNVGFRPRSAPGASPLGLPLRPFPLATKVGFCSQGGSEPSTEANVRRGA
jgi:hypothetical protein